MTKSLKYTLSLIIFSIVAFSCASDMVDTSSSCDTATTYSDDVKDIIDQTCAYNGCHNGLGSAPGDYSSYSGLKRYLDDGSFVERVIDKKNNPTQGMPPNNSIYPESLQDDLSDVQLQIITCWIQNNFPE